MLSNWCQLIIGVLYLSGSFQPSKSADNPAWWEHGVFYQIYPRSFKDDNNDGNGDLIGITNELEHLQDAGITGAWLSPIYKSPQKDAGYDISDFFKIDPMYGEEEDFDNMIAKAKELNIKIIMDFVPNHSSNECEWFTKSELKEAPFTDYYVWKEGNSSTPPNNWLSVFHGSAWKYSDIRKEWYFHQFAPEQPDLNYENPALAAKMEEVLEFWLERGVDGFRMDAVPYLFEDELLRDEPPSGDPIAKPNEHESLNHIYTKDHPKTYDLIYRWRSFIDKYNTDHPDIDPKILMSEAYTDLNYTMLYYGNGTHSGAHIPFNFLMVGQNKDTTAQEIVDSIYVWLDNMPTNQLAIANWVVGNHDNPRVATRYGPERVDGVNALIALLPGIMVTYNGEEIGQENGYVPQDQCEDPRGCNALPEDYNKTSRDFERTPFHWNSNTNAGFNDGSTKPWLPVSDKYTENNLALQTSSGAKSYYKVYQNLLTLRQNEVFSKGNVSVKAVSENVILLLRSLPDASYALLINIGDQIEIVDLATTAGLKGYLKVEVSNTQSNKDGRTISLNPVLLDPYETVAGKVTYLNTDWWKDALVYQIYPRSFKDANNDGIGDLKGIIEKVDHFKNIGVTAVWLSPIYKSPQVDQGYDIEDFKAIDEDYGDMTDFRKLVEELHQRGIKILMDFVPNHSSNKCAWFTDSEKSEGVYKDFYIWKGQPDDKEPNNWRSIFKYSAWTYSEKREQYYLHQFAPEQPDLNYRSEDVKAAMKDVLKFWMDEGVDGFRMDAVPYLVEDEDFREEPRSNDPAATSVEWRYLRHIYTSDHKETFDVIYEWRKFLDEYSLEKGGDARIMMTEAYTDIYTTMYYYGNNDVDGAHFTFNFQLIEQVNQNSTADDFAIAIREWLKIIPKQYTSNWVMGNHDKPRLATRFGPKNIDGFIMLGAFLPGVMVTYNGEEIGMENGEVTYEQGKDPSAINGPKEKFNSTSRDFERTPFHWDDTVNAGFNDGSVKPWLPVSEKHKTNNLKAQIGVNGSHYEKYRQIIQLRKEYFSQFIQDTFNIKAVTDTVLVSTKNITLDKSIQSVVHLFNIGSVPQSFNLATVFNELTNFVEIIITNGESKQKEGGLIDVRNVTLDAHESVIAITTTKEIVTSAASIATGIWRVLVITAMSVVMMRY